MAVSFGSDADYLYRNTDLPSTTAFTIMGWWRWNSLPGGGFYDPIFTRWSANDAGLQIIAIPTNRIGLGDGGADYAGTTTIATGTWYHLAWVRESTTVDKLYVNGALEANVNLTDGIGGARVNIGSWSYGGFPDARVGAVKIFNSALTIDQVKAEMWQYRPCTVTPFGFYPLWSSANDEIDFGPGGRTLTVNGSPATQEGPPIPWEVDDDDDWSSYVVDAAPAGGNRRRRMLMGAV